MLPHDHEVLLVVVPVPVLLLGWLVDRRRRVAALFVAAAMLLWIGTVVSAVPA